MFLLQKGNKEKTPDWIWQRHINMDKMFVTFGSHKNVTGWCNTVTTIMCEVVPSH